MGIKDQAIDWQRQRHTVAAKDFSCFDTSGNGILDGNAELSDVEVVVANGTDAGSNAAGTTITVGSNGFADVIVGDVVLFGDSSPVRATVTARTNTTATVAAVETAKRSQTAQDWVVYRPVGLVGAELTAQGAAVSHIMRLPSHWDARQDLIVAPSVMATDGAGAALPSFTLTYGVVADGDLLHGTLPPTGDYPHSLGDAVTVTARDRIQRLRGADPVPATALSKGAWVGLRAEQSDSSTPSNSRRLWIVSFELDHALKMTTGAGAKGRPTSINRQDRW